MTRDHRRAPAAPRRGAQPDRVLYGRLPGYHLSELGRRDGRAGRRAPRAARTSPTSCRSPLERAQETAAPIAEALGLAVAIDERLIEAGNVFEGKTFGVGDGALRQPAHWQHLRNPFRPSWGEPYVEIAERMLRRVAAPGTRRAGTRRWRQPPAADLDGAVVRERPAAVARPAQAAVLAGVAHVVHLRRRRPASRCPTRSRRATSCPVPAPGTAKKFVAGA